MSESVFHKFSGGYRSCKIYRYYKYIFPAAAGIIALIAYWLTVDPGPSYWDCPEYLITALRLEIGHPPGNPGWALTHRFFSCFFPDPAIATLVVNLMAGIFTALSVMLLCSVIITLFRFILPSPRAGGPAHSLRGLIALAASLCFAFSDSAWYSAVEAEVYAMSLFLSSLTIWMALKWAFAFSRAARARMVIALFYIIGFSLGVHQLNLLALPAIALIMAAGMRKSQVKLPLRLTGAFLIGCLAVGVILKGFVPGSVALAESADIFFVNTLRLPFWSGALTFWLLSLAIAVMLALRKAPLLFWPIAALMTGFSVYILIPVRAWANPPVNEGNPSSVTRFADYLDRRQYGGAPLFYGRTPESRIMRMERMMIDRQGDTTYDYSWNAMKVRGKDMRPMLRRGHIPSRSRFLTDEDKALNAALAEDTARKGYVVAGFRTEPVYTPELNMLLPRIHSGSPADLPAYRDWTGMDTSNMVKVRISEAIDSLGNPVPMRDSAGNLTEKYAFRPTYMQSLAYLGAYQIGYMYLRYLMWNYSGRQNDVPASGEIDHGNFITGVAPLDNLMLGDQSALPEEIGAGSEGHNLYWAIPFLLGILGIIYLFSARTKGVRISDIRSVAWFSTALFLMTGVAIVFYLNQTPGEPRERDYTFLMSFWTFALWIAFGMMWLIQIAGRRWLRGIAAALMCAVPLWMLAQNITDHDRSRRSATLDFAGNLLMSLDRDAILFVDGDNYIFPLWYAQEVMGIRRDVTVVCYSYLGSEWYVTQLMTPRHEADGVPMTATEGDIALGNYNLYRLPGAATDTVPAVEALRNLYFDMSPTPAFSHRRLLIGRDADSGVVFDLLSIPGKHAGSLAGLRELATVDIIATNAASRYPRPIYWHQNLSPDKYIGFFPYTRQELYTRKLNLANQQISTDAALNVLPDLKSGGIDRMAYPGPDVTAQAQQQRASLIRLAQALGDEGRHNLALFVARMAMVSYPSRIIPFSIRHHIDSAYFEARSLAGVLRRSGEALGDTAAVNESCRILRADSIRTEAYRRYRRAIPPWRRSAISPRSNNHTVGTQPNDSQSPISNGHNQ